MSTAQGGISSLTPRELATVEAFKALHAERGYPPTRRELAERMGISLTRASQFVARLELAGVIRRDAGTPRGLVLLEAAA